MKTKSFLKIWLLSVNFEKFTSINLSRDQSQHFKRSTVIGPSIRLWKWISQSWRKQPIFQEWLFVFIIASVKYHLKSLGAIFLRPMTSLKWTHYNYLLYCAKLNRIQSEKSHVTLIHHYQQNISLSRHLYVILMATVNLYLYHATKMLLPQTFY